MSLYTLNLLFLRRAGCVIFWFYFGNDLGGPMVYPVGDRWWGPELDSREDQLGKSFFSGQVLIAQEIPQFGTRKWYGCLIFIIIIKYYVQQSNNVKSLNSKIVKWFRIVDKSERFSTW